MFLFKFITFYFLSVVIFAVKSIDVTSERSTELDDAYSVNITGDILIAESIKASQPNPHKKVSVKLYYESLCPFCRDFGQHLKVYAEKLQEYIDLQLYPYGNAETGGNSANYMIECQHGEAECYGNKLHACAIDILGNITQAVVYISCMMDPLREDDNGSNDAAADECAAGLFINSEPIKSCAKSRKGSNLHKYYGDETDKANIDGVPHILINGQESNSEDFGSDLTDAILQPMNSSRRLHNTNIYLITAMALIWFFKST